MTLLADRHKRVERIEAELAHLGDREKEIQKMNPQQVTIVQSDVIYCAVPLFYLTFVRSWIPMTSKYSNKRLPIDLARNWKKYSIGNNRKYTLSF